MGTSWLRVFTGIPVPGPITEDIKKDIPYPWTELWIHVTYKTIEAGSIIGGFVATPIMHLLRRGKGRLGNATFNRRLAIYGRRGIIAGIIIAPIMQQGLLTAKKATPESVYDRCYRLRNNEKQLVVDRAVTVGALAGFATARWTGLIYGINLATIAAAAYNASTDKKSGSEKTGQKFGRKMGKKEQKEETIVEKHE